MDPVILPNAVTLWPFLLTGFGLLIAGVFCFYKKKLDGMRQFGMIASGLGILLMSWTSTQSRIELHEDKIVDHKHVITTKRIVIHLDGITKVTAVGFEDGGDEKESWLFFQGENQADTIMVNGNWDAHRDRIIEFLGEKGITFSQRKAL